jgi:hypothetical protein
MSTESPRITAKLDLKIMKWHSVCFYLKLKHITCAISKTRQGKICFIRKNTAEYGIANVVPGIVSGYNLQYGHFSGCPVQEFAIVLSARFPGNPPTAVMHIYRCVWIFTRDYPRP